jgi:hypothetical protein
MLVTRTSRVWARRSRDVQNSQDQCSARRRCRSLFNGPRPQGTRSSTSHARREDEPSPGRAAHCGAPIHDEYAARDGAAASEPNLNARGSPPQRHPWGGRAALCRGAGSTALARRPSPLGCHDAARHRSRPAVAGASHGDAGAFRRRKVKRIRRSRATVTGLWELPRLSARCGRGVLQQITGLLARALVISPRLGGDVVSAWQPTGSRFRDERNHSFAGPRLSTPFELESIDLIGGLTARSPRWS